MKSPFLLSIATFLLVSCNPADFYNQNIEKLGYIAYRTPLDSVGSGTIVKGQPGNLIVFADPERCLPSADEDGTVTHLRWEGTTDLPQHLKEAKFDFSTDLAFFGVNGNPLFKFKAGVSGISKVEVKFSDAKVEFIDEIIFWKHFKTKMEDSCQKALLKYPLFWKVLKIGKMEYVFRNQAGGTIALTAEGIKEVLDFSADVSWSIKEDYTLTIETPKYIGFLAAKIDQATVNNEDITIFSNKLNSKGNYIWENAAESFLKSKDMNLKDIVPLD